MATIYISPASPTTPGVTPGNDTTGNGSEALPYRTPSKAGDVANPGDTVLARGGTYTHSSEHDFSLVGSSGNLIVFTAYPNESPVFEASGTFGDTDAIWSLGNDSQYCTISNMELRNNNSGTNQGRGMEIESSISPKANHITIQDMVIHNVAERGLGGGGNDVTITGCEVYEFAMSNEAEAFGGVGGWATGIASYSYSDDSLPTNWSVSECYVHHGWGEGINILRVTGFVCDSNTVETVYSVTCYPDKAQDVEITNNKFVFNDISYRKNGRNAHGITLSGEGTPMHSGTHEIDNIFIANNEIKGMDNAISWFQDTNHVKNSYRNVEIYHNSVYSCNKGMNFASIAALAPDPTGCVAKNNIFDGVMTSLSVPAAWTFTHNCWIDGIPSAGTHTNSIHANPAYETADLTIANDLTLLSTSPCIGVGTYLATVPLDRDGSTRPNPPSMGAYEQAPTDPPPDPEPTENVQAYLGSFLTGTDVTTTQIPITGVGFQPKAVIFWWVGRTEAVDTAGSASNRRGMGFATSATARCSQTSFSLHATGTADTAERHTDARCISILEDATTVNGELDFVSMDADGFTLVVDDQFTTSFRIHYLALGGDGLTNATVFTMQAAVATGEADTLAGLAFQPTSLLMLASDSATAPPTTGTDSHFMIGAAVSAAQQAVYTGGSNDGAATTVTASYIKSGECIAIPGTSFADIVTRAALVQFNADGARFNWTEVSGNAHYIFGLALRGGSVAIGDFLTQTDDTTIVTETLDFETEAALFVSAHRVQSTADTVTNPDSVSFGCMANAQSILQGAVATLDENGADTSDVHTGLEFDSIFLELDGNGALAAAMRVDSIDNTTMNLIMADAAAAQSFVFYWAIGNVAVVDEDPPGASEPIEDRSYVYKRRLKR